MNRVAHFEIHAPDPSTVVPFYERVFGWKVAKWEGPVEYFLVTTGEGGPGINGGILRSKDGQPRTVNTVRVHSVDEYVARVPQHGGEIVVPKMAIPGVGWVAYAKDPGGVLIGIYEHDQSAK